MTENVIAANFHWEQNPSGGEDGTATFFPGAPHETTLRIDTFAEAHALARAIEIEMRKVRLLGRMALFAEIGRIKP